MDSFDFVVIGAGAAGEAASYKARERGASVAVVERDLFGGGCPFWACIPSKSLLHSAAMHAACAGTYSWSKASDRRDYMINREGLDYPDDTSHFNGLEAAGAVPIRGDAYIKGPGIVEVQTKEGGSRTLQARFIVVAIGSYSKIPPIEDIMTIKPWTNREATSTRELPKSFLVLGGGPTGLELAQAYARFGVPTTIVESNHRLLARDHPRNSAAIEETLKRDGVTVRTGVRALKARANAGTDGAHAVDLNDGSSVQGHAVLLAIGRTFPLDGLGLENVGIEDVGAIPHDGRLELNERLYLVGDPAGPELHTHMSHYQGEIAIRMALGDDIRPDYRAIPRSTYTEPEAASVGFSLEQALERGIDAFELVEDFAVTAKGYSVEAEFGHVTIVIDRATQELVGAALATPDASAAIHEAVLAIKAHIPISVLADTIHAFPSTSRIFNGLFAQADKQLAGRTKLPV